MDELKQTTSRSTPARRILADEIHRAQRARAPVEAARQIFERLRDELARAENELTSAKNARDELDARYAEALQNWAEHGENAPQPSELAREKAEADRRVEAAEAPLTATRAALERAQSDLNSKTREASSAQHAIGDATLLVLGEIANEVAAVFEQRARAAMAADDTLRGLIEFLRKHSGWLRENDPGDKTAWRKCNAAWSAVGKLRTEAQARAERGISTALADAERQWTDFMIRLAADAAAPAPGTEA